jgi:low affinity Fe/Cu permease
MYKTYHKIEKIFEKLTIFITRILGNSITFILAFIMVLYWWSNNEFTTKGMHQTIGDIIFGTTFLSLFIIQKSFNRFSALMHLKINKLVSSHEGANNAVIHAGTKTEKEITTLANEFIELIENEILEKK